jgi:hypothetical protein
MISQLWAHGSAESVTRLMDKDTLVSCLVVFMVILSTLMGYLTGLKHG